MEKISKKVYKISANIIFACLVPYCIWFYFPRYFSHRDLPNRPIFPNKTVLGVDANQNGVRDEIEIKISRAIPKDDALFALTMAYAKAYQTHLIIVARNREEALQVIRDTRCVDNGDYVDRSKGERRVDIQRLTLNTDERFDKARSGVYSKIGLTGGVETACGSTKIDRPE